MKARMRKQLLLAVFMVMLLGMIVPSMPVKASADSGLVGLWHFDEGVGTYAYDSSGCGNHGTVYGATWTTDAKFGEALSFDGIYTGAQEGGDYVFVHGASSLYITDKITVEAWIKPTGIPDRWYGDVVRLGLGYELCLRGDGKLEIALYRSGGWGWWDSVSAIPIPATTFYHVAFTYDKDGGAKNLKIYIDGALDAEYTVTGALAPLGDLWISPWFWPFEGVIDEVRIWDQALTADQVEASYNLAFGTEIKEKDLDGDGHPDVIFTSAFYELESGDTITATILPVDPSVTIDATTTNAHNVTPKGTQGSITKGILSPSGYSLPITVTQGEPPCKSIHIWLYLNTGDHLGVNAQFLPYD
jgi:hypothetical protein